MSAVEKPKRISAAEREIMLHEERMAQATKRVSASETVSVKQGGTGTLAGKWYCDGLLLVKEEGEDWPQFLGRLDSALADVQAKLTARNFAMFEQQGEELERRRSEKAAAK